MNNKLEEIIKKFEEDRGVRLSINYQRSFKDDFEIDLQMCFYDTESFANFIQDLNNCTEASRDKELRNNSKSLASAWDEYQLLLKLLK